MAPVMKGIKEILNILDSIGPVVATLLLFINRKKLSREMYPILIFCIIQLCCNTIATIIEKVFDGNNYWVYKINATTSFLCLSYLFLKKLFQISNIAFSLFLFVYAVINMLLLFQGDGISQFNSTSAAIESLAIVSFCLYFFYARLINTSEEISIPETSIFWCIVGIFTYYAGAFFIFISYKYLIHSDSATVGILWRFHNILLFICCAYISYGVLCKNYRTILS